MEFKLKGIPGLIAGVVIVGALVFLNVGIMKRNPTPDEIRTKVGERIIDSIRADVVRGQSELLQKAEDAGYTKESTKEIAAQVEALENIEIVDIKVRPLRYVTRKKRRNLLHRNTECLLQVDYTMGTRREPRSIVLELKAPRMGNWSVSPSIRTF